MEDTIGDRQVGLDAICLGIAGVDRPRDAQSVKEIMRRIGRTTPTVVVNDALDFMLTLDVALTLVPYLLAAAYAVKLAVRREAYLPEDEPDRRKQLVYGLLACVYSVYLIYAAGVEYLLVGCLIYAPGAILYVVARREHQRRVFTHVEATLCGALVALAVLGAVLIINGTVDV